jgi:hypothetical protein
MRPSGRNYTINYLTAIGDEFVEIFAVALDTYEVKLRRVTDTNSLITWCSDTAAVADIVVLQTLWYL